MSVCCNITVQFQIRSDAKLLVCAQRHLETMAALATVGAEGGYDLDAHRMLEYAAKGHGVGFGSKGDMFTWGNVGNYSSIENFVEALTAFWVDLYADHAMFDFDGIVVMFQQEQKSYAKITEISNDRTIPGKEVILIRRDWETPFPLFGWFFERLEAALPSGIRTTTMTRRTP